MVLSEKKVSWCDAVLCSWSSSKNHKKISKKWMYVEKMFGFHFVMGFKDLQFYQHHFWAVLTPPLTSYSNMMLKGLIIGHWVYVWSYHFCSIHECFNITTNPKQLCASQHNRFLSTIGFSIWVLSEKKVSWCDAVLCSWSSSKYHSITLWCDFET